MLEEAPDSAPLRFNIGLAYEGIGDPAGARKAYLRATDVDPKLAEAWLNLGAMAEREGDHARALQNYRAGLRHAENDPKLFAATIGVLRKLGRHDEAIREARSAIKTNGNNVDAYNNLGLVYLDQGRLELA
jgi:tetratricopeptide (TPR) repeat protein